MTRHARARSVHAAVTTLAAILVAASTCDNQDFSGSFRLHVDANSSAVVRAFRQPYVGRITLDFGLSNTGETESSYEITVQVQTTGDIDSAACEAVGHALPLQLDALAPALDGGPPEGGAPPIARSLNRLHTLLLPDGDGWIQLRIRKASEYRLYTDTGADEVHLFSERLTEIEPIGTEQNLDSCPELSTALAFDLDDGTYPVSISSSTGSATLLVEEVCTEVRTVPRSCPGTAAPIRARDPITLAPGAFVSGRISSNLLGVGDQAVIGLECGQSTPSCSGDLEVFFLVEQLECRTDNDCSNVSSCDNDGYCQRGAESGCSTTAGRPHGLAFQLLSIVGLVASRRRR